MDGTSLAVLRPPQAQLTVPQRLGVLRGVLEGLAYAHRNGIVHGSVSPRTILIEEDGTPKLVEFAAWPGHPDEAGIGAYASPEAFAGEDLSPASDVYSVGALLSEIALDPAAAEPTGAGGFADLQPVVDRAMAAEPSERHPDAQSLLDDLDRAARRSFGPVWWTTEGLGVPANRAQPSSRGIGRKAIIAIVAGITAAVVGVASALALTQDDGPPQAEPAAASSVPAVSAAPSTSAAPTPLPTSTTNPAQYFKGVYRYVAVVTKSTSAAEPVGSRQTATWSAKTTCQGATCTSNVDTGSGQETLTSTDGVWNSRVKGTGQCINLTTQKPTGQQVPNLFTRSLKPTMATTDQILTIAGTDRFRQTKKCRTQKVKNYDVTRKITLTYQD